MASSNHAVLDLGDEDLQFTTNDYKSNNDSGSNFTSFPEPNSQADRDTDNVGGDEFPGGEGSTKTSNFWSMSFYQQFFDVEDKDIFNRLIYSMVPIPGKSFLQHHIRPKPDLYGPFWACVTLIFSIAISGNIADYLSTSLLGQAKWHYDFHKVTLASTAVFSYAGLIPACLYGYLWWVGQGGAMTVSFVELLCLYGYSVTIYIPISVLWLICVKVGWLQWVLVLVGASLSGFVLFTTVWPMVREAASKSAAVIMVVVLGLHFLLACGFMLYFFHASSPQAGVDNVIIPSGEEGIQSNNSTIPKPAALQQGDNSVTDSINAFNPGEDPDKSNQSDEEKKTTQPKEAIAAPVIKADGAEEIVTSAAEKEATKAAVSEKEAPENTAGVESEATIEDSKPLVAASAEKDASKEADKDASKEAEIDASKEAETGTEKESTKEAVQPVAEDRQTAGDKKEASEPEKESDSSALTEAVEILEKAALATDKAAGKESTAAVDDKTEVNNTKPEPAEKSA